MLRKIWQWIVSLFQGLFGKRQKPEEPLVLKQASKPLEQADYEYLFMELLEGVAHGWQQARVKKFFDALQERVTAKQWVEWLRGFGERLLASPVPNNELAARMVQLGELGCGEIGATAQEIGMQLLVRNPSPQEAAEAVIGQQDESTIQNLRPVYEYEEAKSQEERLFEDSQEASQLTPVSLDELLLMLEQDSNLIQHLAQQLEIETTDPQVIIQALLNQSHATNQLSAEQAEALVEQSVQQFQAGDYEAAINSVNHATQIAPGNESIWYSRGELMVILEHYEEAIASYDKATQIDPGYYQAWYNRGSALRNLERYDEALTSYNRAIQIKPDYYEAWYNQGAVLRDLGRHEEAVASYDKALELKPSQQTGEV